jgi:aspartyl protease family protein
MSKFIVWAVAIGIGVAVLAPDREPVPPAPIQKLAKGGEGRDESRDRQEDENAGNGWADTTLTRADDGHFYADAMVNGARIRFLVDTGATSVALSKRDAQAAGVQFASGDFTAQGHGVGGVVALKPVKLDRLAIGPVEARDVDAVVAEDGLEISLLGQSWLKRVGNVTIKGDKMVLR